jgi:hypothetical protein
MHCSNCGHENAAGQKFCGNCGNSLAAACSNCGAENPPGNRFCGECGTGLAGGSPVAAAAPSAEPDTNLERRIVSVLFVDLVNYTTFSEGRDAEDVRSFLSDYFDRSREIIERFGGVVESSSVMPSWPLGAPSPPTRMTRNGPFGPAWSWSTWWPNSEPTPEYRKWRPEREY